MVETCAEKGRYGARERIVRILDDDGGGEGWMKKLEELRRDREAEKGEREEERQRGEIGRGRKWNVNKRGCK